MAPSLDYPASLHFPLSYSPQKQIHTDKQPGINVNVVEIIEEQEDPLVHERTRLRRHLGLSDPGEPPCETPQIQPLFFIERGPDSKGVKCNLPGCTDGIKSGDLRLALNPGMGENIWFRSSSDYYHIPCFERLADLTDSRYLNRIQPLTRHTFKLRGLKPSSVVDGSYLVPAGVERLILEWKFTRGVAIDKRDGIYDPRLYTLDAGVYDLLYKAGSGGYWPTSRPGGLEQYEYYVLMRLCAVNEVDRGVGWNLFEEFLGDGEGALADRHDFSEILGRWSRAEVEESGEIEEHVLSATAVRAIRRLSAIPTPQVGFNRLY
ncbi:hypothetical protein BJX99DRAFT_250299 [Aspergillus californicus]